MTFHQAQWFRVVSVVMWV